MSKVKKHHQIDTVARAIADWRSMTIVHAIYEQGPLRYTQLSESLEFSPTVLSQKLAVLSQLGVVERQQKTGTKEVTYRAMPAARKMVRAYHLLEAAEGELRDQGLAMEKVV
jgi:DNA-binding HxlR family transcriptional regulator